MRRPVDRHAAQLTMRWGDRAASRRRGQSRSRFPPPWSIEETDACFIVKDHAGQSLAYVYFEDEPGRGRAHEHESD
jgi:hypothetical protein